MSDDPGRNALKRFFTICASSGLASSSAQSACPSWASIHGGVAAVAALRRVQPVVKHAPALARVVGGVLDPHHVAAELAHGGGKAVDRGHDRARLRHLALEARLHEVVLHVDHDERGLGRLDHVEGMRPPGARGDAVHEVGGDRQFVHGSLLRGPQQCSNFYAGDARACLGAWLRFGASATLTIYWARLHRFLARIRGRRGTGNGTDRHRSIGNRFGFQARSHGMRVARVGAAKQGKGAAMIRKALGLLLWTAVSAARGAVAGRRRRQGQAQDGRGRALAVLHSDVHRAVERLRRRRGARGRVDHRQWRRSRRRAAALRPDRVRARRSRGAGLHLQRRVAGQAGDLLRADRDRRPVPGVAAEARQVRLVDAQRQEDHGLASGQHAGALSRIRAEAARRRRRHRQEHRHQYRHAGARRRLHRRRFRLRHLQRAEHVEDGKGRTGAHGRLDRQGGRPRRLHAVLRQEELDREEPRPRAEMDQRDRARPGLDEDRERKGRGRGDRAVLSRPDASRTTSPS